VQPTYYMWANVGHYPLTVAIDGGDIATLADALVQRIDPYTTHDETSQP
jgi:hypothetical protein